MDLQSVFTRYRASFLSMYGKTLSLEQWSAFNAITGCKQGQYGELQLSCLGCLKSAELPRSCGHRACNQCQHNSTQAWLDRQLNKQVPVDYYMVTFTLPRELRSMAKAHRKLVYSQLMQCATSTLKTFGLNKKGFNSELGMCAVLHTHTRRLDYHPHVHIIVPGGGIHRARREWRKIKGDYLFNGFALAKVFRARLLKALSNAALSVVNTPKRWVVQCKAVGKGKEALQYLSRYLYRGVVSNKNIINDNGETVTFQFLDSRTKQWNTRQLSGEDFIWLILQHVLPKGFRRVRDYGFLHGNAKQLLRIVQWVLKVPLPTAKAQTTTKAKPTCSHCSGPMIFVGIRFARPSPS